MLSAEKYSAAINECQECFGWYGRCSRVCYNKISENSGTAHDGDVFIRIPCERCVQNPSAGASNSGWKSVVPCRYCGRSLSQPSRPSPMRTRAWLKSALTDKTLSAPAGHWPWHRTSDILSARPVVAPLLAAAMQRHFAGSQKTLNCPQYARQHVDTSGFPEGTSHHCETMSCSRRLKEPPRRIPKSTGSRYSWNVVARRRVVSLCHCTQAATSVGASPTCD